MRPSDKAQAAAGICRSESSEEMMRAFTAGALCSADITPVKAAGTILTSW